MRNIDAILWKAWLLLTVSNAATLIQTATVSAGLLTVVAAGLTAHHLNEAERAR